MTVTVLLMLWTTTTADVVSILQGILKPFANDRNGKETLSIRTVDEEEQRERVVVNIRWIDWCIFNIIICRGSLGIVVMVNLLLGSSSSMSVLVVWIMAPMAWMIIVVGMKGQTGR
eukprot:scaffold11022_cov38-Cyclotella_meneghiniana.AAC.2